MFQRNNAAFFTAAPILPILHSQLERNLHGSGAIVGIKNVSEGWRNDVPQLPSELLYGGMREAGEQYMIERAGLRSHGRHQPGVTMPVQIHPPGGNSIDDLAAVGRVQIDSLGAHYPHRFGISVRLGEWMPDFQPAGNTHAKASR